MLLSDEDEMIAGYEPDGEVILVDEE